MKNKSAVSVVIDRTLCKMCCCSKNHKNSYVICPSKSNCKERRVLFKILKQVEILEKEIGFMNEDIKDRKGESV